MLVLWNWSRFCPTYTISPLKAWRVIKQLTLNDLLLLRFDKTGLLINSWMVAHYGINRIIQSFRQSDSFFGMLFSKAIPSAYHWNNAWLYQAGIDFCEFLRIGRVAANIIVVIFDVVYFDFFAQIKHFNIY